jgi:hypothetical protein
VVAVPSEIGIGLLRFLASRTLSHRFDGSFQRRSANQFRYLDAGQLAVQPCFAIGKVVWVERPQVSDLNSGCFKDSDGSAAFADRLVASEPAAVPFSRVGENRLFEISSSSVMLPLLDPLCQPQA